MEKLFEKVDNMVELGNKAEAFIQRLSDNNYRGGNQAIMVILQEAFHFGYQEAIDQMKDRLEYMIRNEQDDIPDSL